MALAKLRRADERCLVLGSSSVLPAADPAAVTKVAVGQIVTPAPPPPAATTIARGAMPALPARGGGGRRGTGGGRGTGTGGGRGVARASPRPPVAPPPPLAAPPRRRPDARTSLRRAPPPRLPPPSQPLSGRRAGPERRSGAAAASRGPTAARDAAAARGVAGHAPATLQDGWRQVEWHAPCTTRHAPSTHPRTRLHTAAAPHAPLPAAPTFTALHAASSGGLSRRRRALPPRRARRGVELSQRAGRRPRVRQPRDGRLDVRAAGRDRLTLGGGAVPPNPNPVPNPNPHPNPNPDPNPH